MAKPTIRDVAELAGVSRKSVSFVVNGLGGTSPATRARIEAAIATLGYVPSGRARALATGRSGLIAFVHDGRDPVLAGLCEAGICDALTGSSTALLVQILEKTDSAGARRFLETHAPDGVILSPAFTAAAALHAAVQACGAAQVQMAHCPGHGPVWSDDRQGAADGTAYLLALGHTRIGFVAGADHCPAMAMREMGVLDTLAQHGLDSGAQLFALGDGSMASGAAAARLLLEISPRPTAILAANEAMAAGVLAAARAAAIAVPGQLSVIAIGPGTLAPLLDPALTFLRVDLAALAGQAAQMLLGRPPPVAGIVPRLIVSGSTAPAPE